MPSFIDSFPFLRSKISNLESTQALSLEEWENKIDPSLMELDGRSDVERSSFDIEGRRVLYIGNDRVLRDFLKARGKTGEISNPELILYSFTGLKELPILRRMKEYPDETDRSEIEAPWAAECAEARSIILVNVDRTIQS